MFFIVSILSLVIIQFLKISSQCESNATIWTYYPCSFIISTTPSFYCRQSSVTSSIDQCTNREMIFFWHFPSGTMTLTLQSDNNRSFLLHLSKKSLSRKILIKNIYHLINNKTLGRQLLFSNENEVITLHSDKYNQCSIKFESSHPNIFDYGTFIRLMVLSDDNSNP